MVKFMKVAGHYVIALAVIGALSALIAVGEVSAAVGVPVIIAAAAAVIGGSLGSTIPSSTE